MKNNEQFKKNSSEKKKINMSISQSNYRKQFQTAVINLEHNLIDEKAAFLRKMA